MILLMSREFWMGVGIGSVLGFFLTVFTVDRFYRPLMKMQIDEIKRQYCKCLERIRRENKK